MTFFFKKYNYILDIFDLRIWKTCTRNSLNHFLNYVIYFNIVQYTTLVWKLFFNRAYQSHHLIKSWSTVTMSVAGQGRVLIRLFVVIPWICSNESLVSLLCLTLPPTYLSCEFAFHVRFQRIVRALSLNCVWNANQRISKPMNIH